MSTASASVKPTPLTARTSHGLFEKSLMRDRCGQTAAESAQCTRSTAGSRTRGRDGPIALDWTTPHGAETMVLQYSYYSPRR